MKCDCQLVIDPLGHNACIPDRVAAHSEKVMKIREHISHIIKNPALLIELVNPEKETQKRRV